MKFYPSQTFFGSGRLGDFRKKTATIRGVCRIQAVVERKSSIRLIRIEYATNSSPSDG
jgi:hypothetical protein